MWSHGGCGAEGLWCANIHPSPLAYENELRATPPNSRVSFGALSLAHRYVALDDVILLIGLLQGGGRLVRGRAQRAVNRPPVTRRKGWGARGRCS